MMLLSLVVPVCNDLDGVQAVVADACALGIFARIVIADDASDVAFDLDTAAAKIGKEASASRPEITVLRSDQRQGAGGARNRALEAVGTSHVLFFDADDHLRPELADLWQSLLNREDLAPSFDFCIFQHLEERRRQEGHLGMFRKDEALWKRAGAVHPLTQLNEAADLAILAQVAAYPWNKIYRTDFLRRHQIRCSETVVHNDIALHWRGFMAAQQVLCAPLLGCEHVLGQGRDHITLKKGAERLQLFQALEDVETSLHRGSDVIDPTWRLAFACFYIDLIDWARNQIMPEFLGKFVRLAQAFLRRNLCPDLFAALNHHNPDLARRGLDLMTMKA